MAAMPTPPDTPKKTREAAPIPEAAKDRGAAEVVWLVETTAGPPARADDLKPLRDAVIEAARVSGGLWLSYLFVLFYFLVAVGGVTHRDLLLQSPVKLPFLGTDLPLISFFWVGPALFLVLHAYVLIHFVLLANKICPLDKQLKAQITNPEEQSRLRQQLPSNVFVQLLAGPDEVQSGFFGFLLRLIAQLSLVVAPLLLLVFFQLQFLPYHREVVTWWQRIAVALDLGLLWRLWPEIDYGFTEGRTRRFMRWHGAVQTVLLLLLVFVIATFPGEYLNDALYASYENDQLDLSWSLVKEHPLPALHKALVAGKVDFAARRPKSLWSNRIVLPGFDAVDHTKFDTEEKLEAATETVSLRKRDLRGAVLIGAKLRKADLTAAALQGAKLDDSDLRNANFGCQASRKLVYGSGDYCAQLQGASLDSADLRGASLYRTQLQGASLNSAQLQGASLDWANLEGASLDGADVEGASLQGTQLRSASLRRVRVWRADFPLA